MRNILNQHGLFQTLFEALPVPVILTDPDAQVIALNTAGRLFFRCTGESYLQASGLVFRCIHANELGGCGKTEFCPDCIIRKAVNLVIKDQEVSRSKGSYTVWQDGQPVRLDVMVTGTRLEYKDQNLALIVIEEISHITRLQGLLPICCSCHQIRDEYGEWIRLEKFIESHSEADFTHDLCPICAERLRQKVV